MGILKIGKEEEKLIREIEDFKATFKVRFIDVAFGIEIALNQISTKENEEYVKKMQKRRDHLLQLGRIVQGITFSGMEDEKSFSVTWLEYLEKSKQYYQQSYGGKTSSKEAVTESQFVYALVCWEKEFCKRIEMFEDIEDLIFNNFFSIAKNLIHNIIYEYVNNSKS